jgi:hypothetical protein
MIGRRVALAVGVLALGSIPAIREGTSSSSTPPSSATLFVKPTLDCVVKSGNTYTAWFGYTNTKSSAITINYGLLNFFKPSPTPRPGQPKTFQPGTSTFVFSASFTSGTVTWFLNGWSATAKTTSPQCSKPQITTTSLPDGTVGAPYNATVQATGGIPPLTFSGPSAGGLTIGADGTISGTPTTPGTITLDVTVTDKIGQTASKDLSVNVEGVLLACGGSTSAGGEGTPGATLTLDANGCEEPVPVVLRVGDQEVELIKAAGTNTFTMEIAWPVEDNANPVPASKIDYDGDGPDAPVQVVWCPNPGELPEGQSWCLVEQHTVIVGGGQMQVTENYFGKNDPTWTRR